MQKLRQAKLWQIDCGFHSKNIRRKELATWWENFNNELLAVHEQSNI